MEKSIFSECYASFLHLLVDARKNSGLTQVQLAKKLKETQSWVSKCERGERRLDIIELRAFCEAMEISFLTFCEKLDSHLKSSVRSSRRGKAPG
ncbi:MAG: helix-turn-helix domain-containing protein [Acidobacteriales bacterium]|nr:helix-turn-helix domain-containing protein [Terriglobales bacterium]